MSKKSTLLIELILIVMIALLAFALRLYSLDQQSFWSDEGLTVHYAGSQIVGLIQRITVGFHNPLYFLGLHFWIDTVGQSDWAIRFYSLMFSVLAVPLVYILGRLLYGGSTGLLAALILAANPFAIYYAQEARMYAQILSLSVGMMTVFILALRRNRLMYWLGFVLLAAACLYTHYFAALAPLAAAVYYIASWLSGRYRPLLGRWLLAHATVLLLYTPWLANAVGMTSTRSWQEPTPPLSLPWSILGHFSLGEVFPFGSKLWLTVAFGSLFFLGCYGMYRLGRTGIREDEDVRGDALLLPIYFFIPMLTMVALATTGHGILNKYLTVALPPFCLILALGVRSIPLIVARTSARPIRSRRFGAFLAILALIFIMATDFFALRAYFTDARYFKPDYRATAAYIAARERFGDVILADGINPNIIFERYYTGELATHRVDLGEADEEQALLAELAGAYDRIWLVLNFHEPGRIEYWLERHGYQLGHDEFSNVELYLYDFPTATEEAEWVSGPPQEMNGPAQLSRYRLGPNPVLAGEAAHLSLVWQVERPPGIAYKVSVRLTDPSGLTVWARDRFPIAGIVPSATWQPGREILDNLGIPVPPGTLPAPYSVSVVLYETATGQEIVKANLGTLEVVPATGDPTWPLSQKAARFWDKVELVGHELPGSPVRAGDMVNMFLLWRAAVTPEEATPVFRLMDGSTVASEQRLDHADYPMSGWSAGELVRYPYNLRVPPALRPAAYNLTVNLVENVTGRELREQPLSLGQLDVRSRPRNYKKPARIAHPLNVQLGEEVRLLGYELSPARATSGNTVTLILYWEALGPTETDYTVFTHLLTPEDQLAAGRDSPPLNGDAPTTSWLPDEYLTDRYELTIPLDAAPGAYPVEIGMYDPITGRRLPVTLNGESQPDDRLLLRTTVQIEE